MVQRTFVLRIDADDFQTKYVSKQLISVEMHIFSYFNFKFLIYSCIVLVLSISTIKICVIEKLPTCEQILKGTISKKTFIGHIRVQYGQYQWQQKILPSKKVGEKGRRRHLGFAAGLFQTAINETKSQLPFKITRNFNLSFYLALIVGQITARKISRSNYRDTTRHQRILPCHLHNGLQEI